MLPKIVSGNVLNVSVFPRLKTVLNLKYLNISLLY